ncbi:MAG: hypothetical protein HWE18_07275 [Gammaproteobacteria bacterium]|nr:hypothetical protein [Gammaproteobacteria bacterium]
MRTLLIILMVCLLCSCSNRMVYNNLDWIITWYSDDYLDLNDEQSDLYNQELLKLLAWHRQEELPKYKHHLMKVHKHIGSSFDEDDIQFHIEEIREHWQRIRLQISEQITPLASELTTDQVGHLFHELEQRNDKKLAEFNRQTPQDRQEALYERWEDNLTEIFGDLSKQQLALLQAYCTQHQFLTPQRIAYLSRYQAALKQVMMVSNQSIEARLKQLLNTPEEFKSEAYLIATQANQQNLIAFLSALSKTLSFQQIASSQTFLLDFVDTIDYLIAKK